VPIAGICYTDTVRPLRDSYRFRSLPGSTRPQARRGLRLDAVIRWRHGAQPPGPGLLAHERLRRPRSGFVTGGRRGRACVRRGVREDGEVLDDGWLNNGPASLAGQLPAGWRNRLQSAFRGLAIELHCLGREDLLRSKLFALCDRGTDIGDCLALAPDETELRALLPWLEQQDAAPGWPAHVRATLAGLARRLGHAF